MAKQTHTYAQATCPANDASPYQFLRDDRNGTNNTHTHAHTINLCNYIASPLMLFDLYDEELRTASFVRAPK